MLLIGYEDDVLLLLLLLKTSLPTSSKRVKDCLCIILRRVCHALVKGSNNSHQPLAVPTTSQPSHDENGRGSTGIVRQDGKLHDSLLLLRFMMTCSCLGKDVGW